MSNHRYKLTIEYDGTPLSAGRNKRTAPPYNLPSAPLSRGFAALISCHMEPGAQMPGSMRLVKSPILICQKPIQPTPSAMRSTSICDQRPISILKVEAVSEEFDARFSARMRHYQYRIVNRRPPLTVQEKRVWLVHRPLDADKMNEAALLLLGKHDFTAFRSTNCQAKSPLKTLSHLSVERQGEELTITASARSFMHNQVRSIVGSLQMVGDGRWPVQQIRDVLESRDRTACGPVAPAHGLYFTRVDYE